MHVRVCTDVGRASRHAAACAGAWGAQLAGTRANGCARGRAGACGYGCVRLRVHCSPESTIFTRNEEINIGFRLKKLKAFFGFFRFFSLGFEVLKLAGFGLWS
ncbi:hypothetical protein CRG98_005498 [Punica granatum]|uniref:Uncharacterized protein n=1 Tax=Punica granatum TaxID=22663 RepID=A0A2I0L094_PUNGR|nr:hypothetical protein CRG98_005498 [Punica granatum]